MLKMKCSRKRYLLFGVTASVFLIIAVLCLIFIPQLVKKDDDDDLDHFSMAGFRRSGESCKGRDCRTMSKRGQQWMGQRYPTCTSEACVLAAARMLKWRDDSVDPCDDFYNYSCGNFLRSHTLPDGWASFGSNDIASEEVDLKIKGIVEKFDKRNDSASLKAVRKVYKSCMNLTHIEENSLKDLKKVLSSKGVGEWPLLQPEWKDCRLDVEWKMAKLNAFGVDSLFRIDTQFQGDDYNAQVVVDVAEPLVDGICDDDYDNVTLALERAEEHREILLQVLSILEVNVTNTTEQDIDELFEFDFMFCNATKNTKNDKWQSEYYKEENITLLKLADLAPQINWIRWRNLIFSELRLEFPHDKQHVYVEGLENYIEDISDLLHVTSSKVLANYLTWKFIFHNLGFLGSPFRQIIENHQHLMKKKIGNLFMSSERLMPRWRQCVGYIKNLMPIAVLREYFNTTYDDDIEYAMEDIVLRVKNEFKIIFKNTRDLMEFDRTRSSHKVDKIQVEVAYPRKGDKFFDKFYLGLGNMSSSFIENGMKLLAIRMQKLIEGVSVSKTIDDMDYAIQRTISPFDLTAYSFFRGNTIIITLAQLQSFALAPNIPKYKALSTFGWTIGHELAHGFDLDALNGSSSVSWTRFPSYVLRDAQRKARCFAEFFPHPRYKSEMTLNSLNEDLCDNQAIYLTFKAYLRYLNKNGAESLLPGLPRVTNEQLFFINYAQQFCEIRRDDNVYASHSPGRRRVNEVLKNFGPFSEAFRCSSVKNMNSPKCDPLWT